MTHLPVTLVLSAILSIASPPPASATAGERVTMQSESGVTIPGEYRHGADGLQGWSPVADRLREGGVSSLVIRFTGSRDHWKADGAAAIAYLRSRIGGVTPLAVAGSSCGVSMALITTLNNPDTFRAVAVLTGPYGGDSLAFVRRSPALAVYAGASAQDGPAPGWARELRDASAHPDSKLVLLPTLGHGVELFAVEATLAPDMAGWLGARLRLK